MTQANWQLARVGMHAGAWTILIAETPFRVGRHKDCQLYLSYDNISRYHAEFREEDKSLFLADMGSTNGTFVNRQRLQAGEWRRLEPEDSVHFAGIQFKLTQAPYMDQRTVRVDPYVDSFRRMLESKAVVPHYQPLVRFADDAIIGYELLGRTTFPGLPEAPGPLFQIARHLGGDAELSALFRDEGVKKMARREYQGIIFFNTLPKELYDPDLPGALIELRRHAPNLRLGLEVHENTAADLETIQILKEVLKEQDISLVYDDFGAGQARLVDIIKVPPDYLKFDMSMIRDIHCIPALQNLLRGLIATCKESGITTLAEGVEKAEEAEVCQELGFDLAQGYFYGRPLPAGPTHGGLHKLD